MEEKFLLNKLREIQKKEGCLSEKSLKKVCDETNIPMAQLYGVATFYAMFDIKPTGKYIIELCSSPSCFIAGALNIETVLKEELKVDFGETSKDKLFTLKRSSCIGCCDKAPAMMINGKVYTKLNEKKLRAILKKCKR